MKDRRPYKIVKLPGSGDRLTACQSSNLGWVIVSAYVAHNVIFDTDGQIYLEK